MRYGGPTDRTCVNAHIGNTMNVVALHRTPKDQTQDQQEAELVIQSVALHDASVRGIPRLADVLKLSRRIHETAERLATLT